MRPPQLRRKYCAAVKINSDLVARFNEAAAIAAEIQLVSGQGAGEEELLQ